MYSTEHNNVNRNITMTDDCKAIEDVIKSLLFKNADSVPLGIAQQEIDQPTVPHCSKPDHLIKSPFQESELGAQTNLASSSHGQNELIDYDALTKFAAQNLEGSSTSDLNKLTNSDSGLPNYPFFDEFNNSVDVANERIFQSKNKARSFVELNTSFSAIHQEPIFDCDFPPRASKELPIQSDVPQMHTTEESAKNSAPESPFQFDAATEVNKTSSKRDIKEKRRRTSKKERREKKKKFKEEHYASGPRAILQRIFQTSSENDAPDKNSEKKDIPKRVEQDVHNIAIAFEKNVGLDEVKVYQVQRTRQGKWNFTCELCDFNTVLESLMTKHIASESHLKQIEMIEEDKILCQLPEPIPVQIVTVDLLINDIASHHGLSEKYIEERKAIAVRINELVSKHLQDCTISIVGASVTRMGLKGTEVDFLLKVPSKTNAADMLSETHQLLIKDGNSSAVYSEFREKIPRIQFRDVGSNLSCNITLDNEHSAQLTKLLTFYASLDPRVPVLGKAFRYWAQICDICDPDKGTLPSFCYPILLIYFLQQVDPPVLPALQETPECLEADDVESFKARYTWCSENECPVGLLWIQLFQFYCFKYRPGIDVISICTSKRVTCQNKNWGTKFYAIEDPIVRRNLAHVIPNRSVFHYIQNCFYNTYRHFGYPQTENGPVKVVARDVPCSPSSHLQPSSDSSSALARINDLTESEEALDAVNCLNVNELLEDHDPDLPFDDVIATISKLPLDDIKDESCNNSRSSPYEEKDDTSPMEGSPFSSPVHSVNCEESKMIDSVKHSEIFVSSPSKLDNKKQVNNWDVGDSELTSDMLSYQFNYKIFKGDKMLPMVCRICQKSGHLKNECPNEYLPPVQRLPPMTNEFMNHIIDACLQIKQANQPSCAELKERENDRLQLEMFIKEIYPTAVLKLFGSFCNGFGFTKSDMDFCLTFEDKDGKDLDQGDVIENLAKQLRKIPRYDSVVPILSAKVPIVKFFDRKSHLECDISLYNTLAQYNTRMLDAYCKIDSRVQILGYVFKYFAKILDICDASKGSLSSYAYILMAIFFLQQRDPPVVPVLQELYEGEMPVIDVDGCNAWFFDDLTRLREVWPQYKENKETVGELWLGLLSFYASEFNMKEYVISIKQKKLLSRFQKLWNSKKIAIEDPFDLNHNLGSGLSHKMNNYIMKAFIWGREHFGTPVDYDLMIHSSNDGPFGYLFDRRHLNKGAEPPRDRGCRRCGKIGHMARDCQPQAAQHKNRKAKRKNDKNIEEKHLQNIPQLQRNYQLQQQTPQQFQLQQRQQIQQHKQLRSQQHKQLQQQQQIQQHKQQQLQHHHSQQQHYQPHQHQQQLQHHHQQQLQHHHQKFQQFQHRQQQLQEQQIHKPKEWRSQRLQQKKKPKPESPGSKGKLSPLPLNSTISPTKTLPIVTPQSVAHSHEGSPPSIQAPVAQKIFAPLPPPPGYESNVLSQQIYSNGPVSPFLFQHPFSPQSAVARPPTSSPFPVSGSCDTFLASSSRSSQPAPVDVQVPHWTSSRDIDNNKFVRDDVWQHVPQMALQPQASFHNRRLDPQMQGPASGFVPVSPSIPAYRQQIIPDEPRTSSEINRFYSPFASNSQP